MPNQVSTVAVLGAGLVGAGWAIVFARAGLQVRLFDVQPQASVRALELAKRDLAEMERVRRCASAEDAIARITVCDTLEDALMGAEYVQESVLETVAAKVEISTRIDALIGDHIVVGSSSSGIPASAFTEGLRNRARFFVVHPVNPPHLIPLVEIVPASWSDMTLIVSLRAFMARVGQTPIVVNGEIEGFVLNRLQGALLNEAMALLGEGYANAADIDLAVSHGLGPRWSFMGPFETIDLNAPQGIGDYAARLAPLYRSIGASRGMTPDWSEETVRRATEERRAILPQVQLADRVAWRNGRLMRAGAADED